MAADARPININSGIETMTSIPSDLVAHSCCVEAEGLNNRETMKPKSYPTHCYGNGHDGADTKDNEASCHRSNPSAQRPQRQRAPPNPPPVVMLRKRTSLVRLPSGSHKWLTERGVDTPRTKAMTRLRMKFLMEEEGENAPGDTSAAAGDEGKQTNGANGGAAGRIEECRRRLRQANLSNETVATSEPAFLDIAPDLLTSLPLHPRSSNVQEDGHGNDEPNDINEGRGNDNDKPHEISLNDSISEAKPAAPCVAEEERQSPVLQLLNKQKIFLDFGEENTLGKVACRSFLIQAPNDSSNGHEFHIRLDQSLSSKGLVCSDHVSSSGTQKYVYGNPIQCTMLVGESKMIYVMWNPVEEGCVRERIHLEVKNADGIEWKQSVVIVGEAMHKSSQIEHPLPDEVDASGNLMETNELSEISNSGNYSIEMALEVDGRGEGEKELELDQQSLVEEKKFEEDSVEKNPPERTEVESSSIESQNGEDYAKETKIDESLERTTMWNGDMVSLELSEIQDVDDANGEEDEAEDILESELVGNTALERKLDGITEVIGSSSSQAGGNGIVAAVSLSAIEEASTPAGSSVGSISEKRAIWGPGEVTEMLHSLDVSYDKPQDYGCGNEKARAEVEENEQDHIQINQTQPTEDGFADPFTAPSESTDNNYVEELVEPTSAEKLQLELEDSLRTEKEENEHFLAEEEKARVEVTNAFEGMLASKGLVGASGKAVATIDDAGKNNVMLEEFILGDANYNHTKVDGESPDTEDASISFGSLSSEDNIDEVCSQTESVPKNIPSVEINDDKPFTRPHYDTPPVPPLSECLMELQSDLVNSSGQKSDAELPSPSEHLILKYPKSDTSDESQDSIELLNKMMKQSSDADSVDRSPDNNDELDNDKSELKSLIEGITKLEEVTQMQQEFITSPSNGNLNLRKQLDNINEQIDGIAPPSAQLETSSPNSGPERDSRIDSTIILKERQTGIQLPSAPTTIDPLPKTMPKESARKYYFYKQPKSNEKKKPATKYDDYGKPIVDNSSERTKSKNTKKDVTQLISSTKKLTMIPENTFKTPQTRRSNQVDSIRDKLRVLKDNSSEPKPVSHVLGNNSKPKSDQSKQVETTMNTPEDKIIKRPNVTKATARKCYFYKSPRKLKKRVSHPKSTSPSPNDILSSSEEKQNQSAVKNKILYSTPQLHPREVKAYKKHINSIREQSNKESQTHPKEDSVQKPGRNGSSLAMKTPSQREMQAFEKHIRSRRERIGDEVSPAKTTPYALRQPTSESAYDRHISRINAHHFSA